MYSVLLKKYDSVKLLCFAGMIYLLVFQNPLEQLWNPFSYIDEIVALFGACFGLYDIAIVRKWHPSEDQLRFGIPLLLFAVIGLAGNLFFQYQPLKCVIIDLYTNLKFFFAIGTGYYLFADLDWENVRRTACRSVRFITLLLFVLFIADRIFLFWPGEVRYGIYSAMLFYAHPTYLAGATACLLAMLMAFYEKKNLPYMMMALVVMAFTLRAKSLASAAVYVILFLFFVVFRWKLKLWHVAAAGAGSVAIAWDKIRYYFIDLSGHSARSVMLQRSFAVMKEHFPIGAGFGTYGSAEAAKHYSPVYVKYGLNVNYELRDVTDIETAMQLIQRSEWLTELYQKDPVATLNRPVFLMDSFWPTIFAQGGILGTIVFLTILGILAKRCLEVERYDHYGHVAVLFVLAYLIIASFAEPAFFNSVAVPLAFTMGLIFSRVDAQK